MALNARTVVIAVQDILNVAADGKWGPRTESAYELASPSVRAEVDKVLAREGYSRSSLKRVTYDLKSPNFELRPGTYMKQSGVKQSTVSQVPSAEKVSMMNPSTQQTRWIGEAELDRLVATAASAQSVDSSLLKGFVKLEANQRVTSTGREYDAQSVSGSFKGLGQMGPKAWADVQSMIGGASYSMAFDPLTNLKATAAYIRKNQSYARAKGYKGPFTPAVAYTLHNQGAGGFMRLLKGGAVEGKQSRAANQIVAQALRDGGASNLT